METRVVFCEVITNFMQCSATWKSDSSSSGQETFDILGDLNAHYIMYKSLQIASPPNQLIPI